jgi:hypothetical protein
LFWASQPKQAAKITRQPMPPAAPAVLLHSLDTRQGASNIILAMTRRDVGKPAFSLRKKRFVKTHALSLLRTKNLRYAMLRFQDFQRMKLSVHLVNGVIARKLVRIKDAEGEEYPVCISEIFPTYPLNDKGRLSPFIRKSGSDGIRFLNLETNVTTINGVWDLPMIGGERLGVEHELHRLLSLPNVNLPDLNNVLVERHDGEMWLLQERYGDIESRKGSYAQLAKMRQYIADNNIGDEEALELNNQYSEARKRFNARKWGEDTTYIPDWLPEDGVLVVRKKAMMEFEQHIRDNEPESNASSYEPP